MAWILEESVGEDESESGRGQWEINGNMEWTVSKSSSVFQQ